MCVCLKLLLFVHCERSVARESNQCSESYSALCTRATPENGEISLGARAARTGMINHAQGGCVDSKLLPGSVFVFKILPMAQKVPLWPVSWYQFAPHGLPFNAPESDRAPRPPFAGPRQPIDDVYKPPTWVNDAIMATMVPKSIGLFEYPCKVCLVQWSLYSLITWVY